jgi:hypothetical protein
LSAHLDAQTTEHPNHRTPCGPSEWLDACLHDWTWRRASSTESHGSPHAPSTQTYHCVAPVEEGALFSIHLGLFTDSGVVPSIQQPSQDTWCHALRADSSSPRLFAATAMVP